MRHCMTTLSAAALALLAASTTSAQIGNPAGMAPDARQVRPGTPAPGQPNTQDRLFVQLLGMGSIAEVEAAKLAHDKASSPAVRDFARTMVRDHADAHDRLTGLAQQAGIALPADVAPEHKAMRAALEKSGGAQFDAAYLQGQLVEHQKTAHLLEWEIASGQDPGLQRFASATLPVVLQHLQSVQALLAQTTGASPQGLAASTSSQAAESEPR